MNRLLRNSNPNIRRVYTNLEAWAKDEIALLCEEWRPYKIVRFDVEPYYFALTVCRWQQKAEYLTYATAGKRLVIRPRLLRIAQAGREDDRHSRPH
jgi:hypothetical protein